MSITRPKGITVVPLLTLAHIGHAPFRPICFLDCGEAQEALLDADAEGADWRQVARIVLHIDPDREPDRARQAFESHLARAR